MKDETLVTLARRATQKLKLEEKRLEAVASARLAASEEAHSQRWKLLSHFAEQCTPDLAEATLKRLVRDFPGLSANQQERDAMLSAGTVWILNPLTHLFGRAETERKKIRASRLDRISTRFWLYLNEEVRKPACAIDALKETHAAVQAHDATFKQLVADYGRVYHLKSRVAQAIRAFERIAEAYGCDEAIPVSTGLRTSVANAAAASIGGLDENGDPSIDPALLPQIQFGTFAYVAEDPKQAIAA